MRYSSHETWDSFDSNVVVLCDDSRYTIWLVVFLDRWMDLVVTRYVDCV
jgi:hypothetical protein